MNRIKCNRNIIIVFLIAFIPRIVLCFSTIPVRTISDEVSTISWAAYFAGYDWSNVISNAGYYGFGMTILFAPVFYLFSDPVIIYRIMLIFCSLFQSLVAVISYNIMGKYFNIKNQRFLSVVAIACSFMTVTRSMIVYNESLLMLLSWIILYILLKLHENVNNKKGKFFYTVVLTLVLSYSLTIHTRALTYWIGLMVLVLIYFWIYRKSLISIPPILILGITGYILCGNVVDQLQTNVWITHGAEKIRNASVSTSGIQHLFNPESWFAWLSIVLGQVNTISVFTGGLILFSIIVFIFMIIRFVFQRKKMVSESYSNESSLYVIVSVFFFVCIASTIVAQSISWLYQVVLAIGDGYEGLEYGFKALTYVRYFGPYTGPILLIGLIYIYKENDNVKKYIPAVVTLFVILQIYWNCCIIPYIHNNPVTNEVYLPFFLGDNYEVETRFLSYFAGTAICTCFFIAFCILIYKRKIVVLAMLLSVLLIYEYGYNAIYIDRNVAVHNYEQIDKTYSLLKQLDEEGGLPNQLYVDDTRDITNDQLFYLYQIYFPRHKIEMDIPMEDENNVVLISNSTYGKSKLVKEGYKYACLDDREYIFVNDEEIEIRIEKLGIKLSDTLY